MSNNEGVQLFFQHDPFAQASLAWLKVRVAAGADIGVEAAALFRIADGVQRKNGRDGKAAAKNRSTCRK